MPLHRIIIECQPPVSIRPWGHMLLPCSPIRMPLFRCSAAACSALEPHHPNTSNTTQPKLLSGYDPITDLQQCAVVLWFPGPAGLQPRTAGDVERGRRLVRDGGQLDAQQVKLADPIQDVGRRIFAEY